MARRSCPASSHFQQVFMEAGKQTIQEMTCCLQDWTSWVDNPYRDLYHLKHIFISRQPRRHSTCSVMVMFIILLVSNTTGSCHQPILAMICWTELFFHTLQAEMAPCMNPSEQDEHGGQITLVTRDEQGMQLRSKSPGQSYIHCRSESDQAAECKIASRLTP